MPNLAREIIEIEKYFMKQPQDYTKYFDATYKHECTLSESQKNLYLKAKKSYGLARQELLFTQREVPFGQKTDADLQMAENKFIEAFDHYTAIKVQLNFEYPSIVSYYVQLIADKVSQESRLQFQSLSLPAGRA